MNVISPVVFQPSHLLSTTVTEAYSAYNAGTSYSIGNKVTYGTRIWESLVNSNVGNTPGVDPTKWLDIAPMNKFAMFDNVVSTVTEDVTSMIIGYQPLAICDTVALINTTAAVVTITVTDGVGGPVVYTNSAGLAGGTILSWYDYFFNDPLVQRTQIVFYGIPPYVNAVYTIEFENSTGEEVSCGQAVFGSIQQIGETQYGVSSGILDFSIKETDEFGTITFVERPYSKRMQGQVYLSNFNLNRVQRTLYELRAKPSVWIATEDPTYEEALVVFGFLKDFETVISYPNNSLISIDIEGLT